MITYKSDYEIKKMREAGKLAALSMEKLASYIKPGISTGELDEILFDYIQTLGGSPSFKGYQGFPGSACISVNDEVVHGIPGARILNNGDIVSVDLGVCYKGFQSDMARTFPVGTISSDAQKLIDVTKECFYLGMAAAIEGNRIHDISAAIEARATKEGYGIVRELVGHGIGQDLHEGPDVPNFTSKRKGPVLKKGMTLAIEPMINQGTREVVFSDDGWTVTTKDGSYSAHYENTIAVLGNKPEILTAV